MLKFIIKSLSTIALTFLIIFLFIGCFVYAESNTYYYYNDLNLAIEDVNNGVIGKHSSPTGKISVIKIDDDVFVELYDDVTLTAPLRIDEANIILNNFTIYSNGFEIATYKNVKIENGNVEITGQDDNLMGIVVGRLSSCFVDNVNITTTCANGKNFSLLVYGKLFLENSMIYTHNTGDELSSVTSVYGNLFSKVTINNCDIRAESSFGKVYGVYIGDFGMISNTKVVALSNYNSNSSGYTSYSIGCMVDGKTSLINCDVYGVHSGVNATADLTISGGTYSGFGHGGVYFSGYNKTSHVRDATIQEIDIIEGYKTFGPNATHGGCYIGGGENQSQITVFVDNCVFLGQKYGIVLRGTDGEQNNKLYISNSILDKNIVRVDNTSHQLFIGAGCNIDTSNTIISGVVTSTNETYN